MKLLFFGDVFGKPGRKMLSEHLPKLKKIYSPDFVIVNAENASHGKGLIQKHFRFLSDLGIDCFTMGNHTWDKNEIYSFIDNTKIVRPYNLSPEIRQGSVGSGSRVYNVGRKHLRVTNLLGISVNMKIEILNPFFTMDKILNFEKTDIHIVDFHAETTSEKNAFRFCFDGKVSAIFGTHTHVPTFDARISTKNTFFITDVGMCGPGYNSVIGADPQCALAKFRNPKEKFALKVDQVDQQLNGIYLQFDDKTNFPIQFEQIKILK